MLLTIPVGVFSAVEASEHVSFRLLHRKDMSPITYKKFCSKEDKEVPSSEIVKGYEKVEAGMPVYSGVLSDSQIQSIILYIKALK